MTASGCSYNGGSGHQVVESCKGCGRSMELASGWYCSACPEPSLKWKNGSCNLATHVSVAVASNGTKINPLKASKRGQR